MLYAIFVLEIFIQYYHCMMKHFIIILLILCVIQIITLIVLSQPKFGRLPKGERLERMKETPTYYNGQFHNLEHTPQLASDKSRWRLMYEFLFEKRENNRPDQSIEALKTNLKAFDMKQHLIFRLGHSPTSIPPEGKRTL